MHTSSQYSRQSIRKTIVYAAVTITSTQRHITFNQLTQKKAWSSPLWGFNPDEDLLPWNTEDSAYDADVF